MCIRDRHITTVGQDLDDLDRYLSDLSDLSDLDRDLSDLSVRRVKRSMCPTFAGKGSTARLGLVNSLCRLTKL